MNCSQDTLEQDARARWRLAYSRMEDALAEAHALEQFALRADDDEERESAIDDARIARQRAEQYRAECNSCAVILGNGAQWRIAELEGAE